jgi:hypothetical protein
MSKVITKMGRRTSKALKKILQDGENISWAERDMFRDTMDAWQAYLVENFRLKEVGKINMLPVGPDRTQVPSSFAMQIYWEICRMKVIVHKEDLPNMVEWTLADRPELKILLKKAGEVVADDEIGILLYTQEEIKAVIFNLVEVLNTIPYLASFREFFDLVELKCATFFCQTMPGTIVNDETFRTIVGKRVDPNATKKRKINETSINSMLEDDEDEEEEDDDESLNRCTFNRLFWVFCTNYVTQIRRRFHYESLFPVANLDRSPLSYIPDGSIERLKMWCHNLADGLADNFDERYKDSCRQAYNFPGDAEWFFFRYPHMSKTVEAQVKKLRAKTAVEFFAQANVSRGSALARTHASYPSILFVLDLLDRYFRIFKQLKWRDGYVIENGSVEDCFEKLSTSHEPFLVQVFSSYWVYLGGRKGKILIVNDIYAAICLWLVCVRKTRTSAKLPPDTLLGGIDISDVANRILSPKEEEERGLFTIPL